MCEQQCPDGCSPDGCSPDGCFPGSSYPGHNNTVVSGPGRWNKGFIIVPLWPAILLTFALLPRRCMCRYAFGITLWEMYTSARPFAGVPQALLGHAITCGKRPEFPPGTPPGFVALAEQCWHTSAEQRPTFKGVLEALNRLLRVDSGVTKRIRVSYYGPF